MATSVVKEQLVGEPVAPFVMPPVSPGDIIMWSQNPDSEPAPAIVTRIGRSAISVLVLPPESRVGIPRDGVRHAVDPELRRIVNEAGVWRQSAQMLRLQALERLLEARRDRVGG